MAWLCDIIPNAMIMLSEQVENSRCTCDRRLWECQFISLNWLEKSPSQITSACKAVSTLVCDPAFPSDDTAISWHGETSITIQSLAALLLTLNTLQDPSVIRYGKPFDKFGYATNRSFAYHGLVKAWLPQAPWLNTHLFRQKSTTCIIWKSNVLLWMLTLQTSQNTLRQLYFINITNLLHGSATFSSFQGLLVNMIWVIIYNTWLETWVARPIWVWKRLE
jgi:hypothetical protein